MNNWKKVKIGDILKRLRRPISLVDDQEYKLVTIQLYHKGVKLRGYKKGSDIQSNMYEVKSGDFILSGIDARNGAFGIVGEELDGGVVTNDFWYFELNEDVIDKHFFLELTSTKWFDEICRLGSDGTTQRIRLQKDRFFNQEITLPPIEQQRVFSKKFILVKQEKQKLDNQNSFQKSHLTLLRQQILQDAISGKLTADWRAENLDVEPAKKLLEHIKAEKEKLIAEKKVKKEKLLLPIPKDEVPFELPERWEWCRLGEIGDAKIGLTYKPSDLADKGTPVLRSNNIKKGKIVYEDLVYVKSSINTEKFSHIGDILICARNGSKHLVGKSALITKDGYSFGAFMSLFRSKLNTYVYYFLQSNLFRSQFDDEKSTGINQLTQGILRGILIPLPPLAEQKAIVAKVEKLMEYVSQLEDRVVKNKKQAEELMQVFLAEVFGG